MVVEGVAEIDRIGKQLGVRPELLMMLEHMILSHHDLPEYGSPKPPMFPEAEVLHVLDLLDAPRKTGLCAASSHLLTPRKSVTALLGLSDHPIESHKRSCPGCPAYDGCQYRKSGGHCGIS